MNHHEFCGPLRLHYPGDGGIAITGANLAWETVDECSRFCAMDAHGNLDAPIHIPVGGTRNALCAFEPATIAVATACRER